MGNMCKRRFRSHFQKKQILHPGLKVIRINRKYVQKRFQVALDFVCPGLKVMLIMRKYVQNALQAACLTYEFMYRSKHGIMVIRKIIYLSLKQCAVVRHPVSSLFVGRQLYCLEEPHFCFCERQILQT